MERFSEAEGTEVAGTGSSIIDAIKQIVAYNARADLDDEHQLLLFLQSWWSKTYNKPLKDPVLASYTIEELIYEFYDRIEREKAAEERVQSESDRIEEAKEKSVLDWVEEEEKKEATASLVNNDVSESGEPTEEANPTENPENIKWMEEQLLKAKQQFGDDFGEDIVDNFE